MSAGSFKFLNDTKSRLFKLVLLANKPLNNLLLRN